MDVLLLCCLMVAGPLDERLPDAEFFAAIDLDQDGLTAVAQAVGREDWPAARLALADYYRRRTRQVWPYSHHDDQRQVAKPSQLRDWGRRILAREGVLDGDWLPDGRLDWWREPNAGHKPRMYFWSSLADAWWVSGRDERLVELWVGLLRDWVVACPPDSGHAYWNGMVAGIRLRGGWPDAFQSFLGSAAFTADDVILFLKSWLEQARFVRGTHWPTGNQLAFAMVGLYTAGVVCPEFREAADWREYALTAAGGDLERGYLPDGMGVELSPGYHSFFYNYLRMVELARVAGREGDPRLQAIRDRGEALYEVFAKLSGPDRRTPYWQDGGAPDVIQRLTEARQWYPENPAFAWFATDGAEGQPPAETSLALPYAGYLMMRSGWERDASCLAFDVGPVGWTHAHQDKLSLVFWAFGRQVLMDPGRHEYSREPLSVWAQDTFAHNTVIVDGRPQRRRWRQPNPEQMPYQPLADFQFTPGETTDTAAGVYTQAYGLPGPSDSYPYHEGSNFGEGWVAPATHLRRVCFQKPDLILVADTVTSLDGEPHTAEARWQLDSVAVEGGGAVVWTADRDLPNLLLVALAQEGIVSKLGSGQLEPEILGWRLTGKPEPATTLGWSRRGQEVELVTLLVALRPSEAAPAVTVVPEGRGQWLVRLGERSVRATVPTEPSETVGIELLP